MSPWMAWYGQPTRIDDLLFEARHGLMNPDLDVARRGAEAEGCGFGLGWYEGADPQVYRGTSPPWDDERLHELAEQVESHVFLAHVRDGAATGEETDCHPFRHEQWLFVHSGSLGDFAAVREELESAIDPSLLAGMQGSTDSELLFHLALTYGLEPDPVGALQRAVGLVEKVAESRGLSHAVHASMGLSDGDSLWVVRYSTRGSSRPLYASGDVHAVQMLYPDRPRLQQLREGDHIIASEPIGSLMGAWDPVPEGTIVTIAQGRREESMFRPDAGVEVG